MDTRTIQFFNSVLNFIIFSSLLYLIYIQSDKLLNLKQVASYDAFDGAPFAKETTEGRVEFLDLSVPVYHFNQYDWVLSLEVTEHIPIKYEARSCIY